MKIFRSFLDVPELGNFLTSAVFEGVKVLSLTVYPIIDGVVGERLEFTADDLPDVVAQIEEVLAEI